MSEHREWELDNQYVVASRSSLPHHIIVPEHNATVRAYRDAMAECERLGKANDDACDRIHALEQWRQETLDENNRLDREPAPIASPDVLEQLAEILRRAMTGGECAGKPSAAYRNGATAILRAAQAYVDVERNKEYPSNRDWPDSFSFTGQPEYLAWMNSRIRYRVALPETPNAQMQRCINRKNRRIDTLKAIVKKWKAKATETAKGLPSAEELVDIGFGGFYGGHSALSFANCAQPTQWAAMVNAILTALRPWLHEPTGWELDVTPDEAMRAYCETYHEGAQKDWQAVLDLCRSRIRPTFECGECGVLKSRLEQSEKMSDKRHEISHRYHQDIKKAHAVLSAALEGE